MIHNLRTRVRSWLGLVVAALAITGLSSGAARAGEMLDGELPIQFPYPLLGRDSFPTIGELIKIAKEPRPQTVLLFALYPDPADRDGAAPQDRNDYYAPAWSPDGKGISFLRADLKNKTSKVLLFPTLPQGRSSKPMTLFDGKGSYDYMLSWGVGRWADPVSSFVFSSTAGPDGNLDVYLGVVETRRGSAFGPARLTKGKALRRCPALFDGSSGARLLFCDGSQVKLLGLPGDLSSLAAASGAESLPDLSGRFTETTPIGYGNYPAWSPDGAVLVYAKQKGEEAGHVIYDLYLRTGDGMERPLFAQPGYRVRTPVWSPDGQGVAFYAAKGEGGWGLFVVDDVRSIRAKVRQVGTEVTTEESFEFVGPAWLSSGRGLLYFPRSGQIGGHYPFQWTLLGKDAEAGAGGRIEYPDDLTTANDLAVSPQRNVIEAAFVATRRLAQDVYIMIATEPVEK